ncbi:MAG: hypothetical protein H3C43_01405 [Leptonema sp. (in: Bacteria)]|nr:hypothetical protein [Leptonema sp. (in: bacteria)]
MKLKRHLINRFLVILATFVAVILISACGPKSTDGSKYAEVCAKVAKCDIQMSAFPDIEKRCVDLFTGLEKKLPEAVPPAVKCIEETSCESLSFAKCSESLAQSMQGMIPGLPQ